MVAARLGKCVSRLVLDMVGVFWLLSSRTMTWGAAGCWGAVTRCKEVFAGRETFRLRGAMALGKGVGLEFDQFKKDRCMF